MQAFLSWLLVKDAAGWPVHLVYVLEGVYVGTAIALSVFGASRTKRQSLYQLLTFFAGFFGGVATMWPIGLAPFFFGVRGEAMLATLPFSFLGLPLAIWFWVSVVRKTLRFHL